LMLVSEDFEEKPIKKREFYGQMKKAAILSSKWAVEMWILFCP